LAVYRQQKAHASPRGLCVNESCSPPLDLLDFSVTGCSSVLKGTTIVCSAKDATHLVQDDVHVFTVLVEELAVEQRLLLQRRLPAKAQNAPEPFHQGYLLPRCCQASSATVDLLHGAGGAAHVWSFDEWLCPELGMTNKAN
jgi:hypothetical protein